MSDVFLLPDQVRISAQRNAENALLVHGMTGISHASPHAVRDRCSSRLIALCVEQGDRVTIHREKLSGPFVATFRVPGVKIARMPLNSISTVRIGGRGSASEALSVMRWSDMSQATPPPRQQVVDTCPVAIRCTSGRDGRPEGVTLRDDDTERAPGDRAELDKLIGKRAAFGVAVPAIGQTGQVGATASDGSADGAVFARLPACRQRNSACTAPTGLLGMAASLPRNLNAKTGCSRLSTARLASLDARREAARVS